LGGEILFEFISVAGTARVNFIFPERFLRFYWFESGSPGYYKKYLHMKKIILTLVLLSVCSALLRAQTPTDAVMMKQRESCFALIYDQGTWDHYWEGDYLRTNGNVGTFSKRMIMPMIAVGLHDKLNLIIWAPYIKTESKEPNGGYLQGASGMQDLGLSLKAQVLEKEIGTNKVTLLANVGFSTPISNYLSDYMPYSLGFGAPEFSLRGIGMFKMQNGFYALAAVAHLWRGQTEIERDYYYNNGSYYTNMMDVPNAFNFNGAIGITLFDNALKLEANYLTTNCTSGDDIRIFNSPQPTNKVEVGQVGFFTQYFFKNQIKGLGMLAYYSRIISGRNMGQFSNVGLGMTYQFKL
jgi:hypothetical protein